MGVEVRIDFEEECPACYGNGYLIGKASEHKPCLRCNGSGYAPTEPGEDLLTFLKRQGFFKEEGGNRAKR